MFVIFSFSPKSSILRSVCNNTSLRSISLLPCSMRNHYESLGVPRNATQADIKAAYYKLSMIYHPDKNETIEAAETFREITEAYEVIGNFKLRKMYDKGLLGHFGTTEGPRTYTNYNPSSSNYRNKPTHPNRMSAYNFDEWSQFHYGDVFSRQNESKRRYEQKVRDTNVERGQNRNENVLYIVFAISCLAFISTYSLSDSLDNPKTTSKPK